MKKSTTKKVVKGSKGIMIGGEDRKMTSNEQKEAIKMVTEIVTGKKNGFLLIAEMKRSKKDVNVKGISCSQSAPSSAVVNLLKQAYSEALIKQMKEVFSLKK